MYVYASYVRGTSVSIISINNESGEIIILSLSENRDNRTSKNSEFSGKSSLMISTVIF